MTDHAQQQQPSKMVKTITLRNGIEMPMLGFGTSLRGKKSVLESGPFTELITHAINYGYRHVDTAKAYNNEQLVGNAIKASNVDRSELFVVSKLFFEDMGYEKTLKAFEKSCRQLQIDYMDLYLIHFPGVPLVNTKKAQPTLEKARELRLGSWRALEKLYADGKCKAIGVSNYMRRHLDELVEANMSLPMVNQCEFHPYYSNKELLDTCRQMGIVFTGYSPLGKGNLLDDATIKNMSTKYGKSSAQILIKWSLQNNVVTIPGSTKPQRVEENIDVGDFELDDDDFNLLWTLNKNEKCTWNPTNVI